jgi:hypothetical protein
MDAGRNGGELAVSLVVSADVGVEPPVLDCILDKLRLWYGERRGVLRTNRLAGIT